MDDPEPLSPINTIHYVEAFDHVELIERWIPIISGIPGLKVVCHVKSMYVTRLSERFLAISTVSVCGPETNTSWKDYLQRISFTRDSVAVVATIGQRPHWFRSFIGRVRYYVVLHNLNYCFNRSEYRTSADGIVDHLRDVQNWLAKNGKRRFFTSADGLIYASTRLAREGMQEPFLRKVRHIVIPFAGSPDSGNSRPIVNKDQPLRVVIPGSINNRVRNYDVVVEALKIAEPFGTKIEVHLAGRVTDWNILDNFKNHFPQAFSPLLATDLIIWYYEKGLSEDAFNLLLQKSDIILSPLRPEITVGRYWELLGITKASGTPFDAVFFAKPLLLPSWHPLMDPAIIHFESGRELGQLLVQYADRTSLPVNCWRKNSIRALRDTWIAALKPSGDESTSMIRIGPS